MATGLGRDIPLGRLGMVTPRGMLGKLGKVGRLGMVMPLGKLGGLTPLGSELSTEGMVGNLGRVPGISSVTRPVDDRMEGPESRVALMRRRMERCDEGGTLSRSEGGENERR